ncbi:MAG: 4-(cytidine 5'-diphospho)-2-C-methyl-D-erythritol kinase [Tabrizicola sp.]
MATEAVSEAAPAKLNLCLHVTGRRGDGYHLLDSLVVFADIADRVFVSPARGLSLVVAGPEGAGLKADSDNLVLRAARSMGVTDAALVLDKRLPIASGVGGGSADAAAALRALARLTGRPLPAMSDVLRLGADVPVCLACRPSRMSGIGERVAPLPPLPALGCVLVNPRLPVPTPQVFAALDRRDNPGLPDLPAAALASASAFAGWLAAHSRNDLVAPALTVAPVLADVQAALEATPGCLLARMSGSGGTHFGLFDSPEAAAAAAAALREAHPFWWTAAGRILD